MRVHLSPPETFSRKNACATLDTGQMPQTDSVYPQWEVCLVNPVLLEESFSQSTKYL